MRTSIPAGSTCCLVTARATTDRRYAQYMRPRRQPPSDALADNSLQKQRFSTNEKHLQQQEEDKWLHSMQAEADADPRNQYWANFAQNKTAEASQTRLETPKQTQQLGATRLGRQRLQQKADSFADMVHLVAAADEKTADASDRPEVSSARGTGPAISAAAISHDTTPRDSHSKSAASTSHLAADQRPIESLSRHSRQRTRGPRNVIPLPTAARHQAHLHRLQDGSTAALRRHSDHKPLEPLKLAGHANDTAAAAPQSHVKFSLKSMDHGQVENRNGQVRMSSSAATAQEVQTQEGLARAKHLQRLEAAAAKWRQRSGSNNPILSNQSCVLDSYGVSTQTAIPSNEMSDLQKAQFWQPLHALDNAESNTFVPQSVESGVGVAVAARPEFDDQQSAFGSLVRVPPPPSRPPKISQAKTKASWLAALRGDAPPGLL